MQKNDELYNELNTLLFYLDAGGFNVVELVKLHYQKYKNTAPHTLLQEAIDKLQKRLDDAK